MLKECTAVYETPKFVIMLDRVELVWNTLRLYVPIFLFVSNLRICLDVAINLALEITSSFVS